MPRPLLCAALTGLSLLAPPALAADTTYSDIFRNNDFRNPATQNTTFRPITHQIELRFGMSYSSEHGMQPGYGAHYRMTLNHQFDNGWQVGFSLGASLDNLRNSNRWHHQRTGL
ncbi:MAG TPA: hypothetical protein GX700_09380 [Paracoccus sp.]|nr:hypothetical protein [Paracoccus sp. (in: a-proteobacteria)]